jgi:TatD DNase family protein
MVIDTHCHLHDPVFASVSETLARAVALGVWGVVAVGCDPATNERTMSAAAALPKAVWAGCGLHPEWTRLGGFDLEQVEGQIRTHHARLVAIGEVGLPWYCLDRVGDSAAWMAEGRLRLERMLALASRYDLPVILHAPHGAAVSALEALRRRRLERAVFHWHKAPAEVTRHIVEAGYFISVTPELVYRERDREMVEWLPLESMLVESDAPWRYEGEFASLDSGPWFAARVAEEVAKIKNLPVDEVMAQLTSNTCQLFDLVWA